MTRNEKGGGLAVVVALVVVFIGLAVLGCGVVAWFLLDAGPGAPFEYQAF